MPGYVHEGYSCRKAGAENARQDCENARTGKLTVGAVSQDGSRLLKSYLYHAEPPILAAVNKQFFGGFSPPSAAR
jgi:hypothetical protein